MKINKALQEFSRVLKDGGDVGWRFIPHQCFSPGPSARRRGNPKDVLFCSYVLLNGALFNCFGIQISFLGRQETFQTPGGIARAMKRVGLTCLPMETSTHFIVGDKNDLAPAKHIP